MPPDRTRRKIAPSVQLLCSEVRAITRLQRHLLPPQVPQPAGWHLAAYTLLGAWPGGDFYDFLPLPDGRLAFLVADASGHGATAAVLVAQLRTVLHACPFRLDQGPNAACPQWGVQPPGPTPGWLARFPPCSVGWCPVAQPPDRVLQRLSRVLEANSLPEQFVTAFYGVLSPNLSLVRYANAGHPSARWWHASDGRVGAVPDGAGPPLGMGVRCQYEEGLLTMSRGDVLVCYTDGLTEAQDGGDFGLLRLDAAIREAAPRGAEAVRDGILAAFDCFLGGKDTEDDVTLLVLQRLP